MATFLVFNHSFVRNWYFKIFETLSILIVLREGRWPILLEIKFFKVNARGMRKVTLPNTCLDSNSQDMSVWNCESDPLICMVTSYVTFSNIPHDEVLGFIQGCLTGSPEIQTKKKYFIFLKLLGFSTYASTFCRPLS